MLQTFYAIQSIRNKKMGGSMRSKLKLTISLATAIAVGLLGVNCFSTPRTVFSQSTAGGSLANSPWPMYQHDPQHTGRSSLNGIASSPKLVWETKLGPDLNPATEAGLAVAPDGTIYVAFGDHLFALDPSNGAINWNITKGFTWSSPAVTADGTLYYGSDQKLFALNPDGSEKWKTAPFGNYPSIITAAPVIDADGNVYVSYFGIHSYDSNGDFRWDYNPTDSNNAPTIGPDGYVYLAGDASMHVLDRNGSLLKTLPFYDAGMPVIAADGTVYATTYYAAIEAVDPQGEHKWSFAPVEDGEVNDFLLLPALGPDGTIYTATKINSELGNSIYLYAVNPDGSLRWKYKIPLTSKDYDGIHNSLIVDKSGRVFACAGDGYCYAFSPDGALLWKYMTTEGKDGSTMIISADGTMILCGGDGVVRALSSGTESTQLKADPSTFWVKPDTDVSLTVHLTSTGKPLTWHIISAPKLWIASDSGSGTTPSDLTLHVSPAFSISPSGEVIVQADDMNAEVGSVTLKINIIGGQAYFPLITR
jgi:outer membrane protein assembly factor BamB